jgi:hypothetical protein
MVRLEAQRRVVRAGAAVYLDSLFAESDSVLWRWPDRPGHQITVAFAADSFYQAARVDPAPARDAFGQWAALPLGLRFAFVPDTASAEVIVRWIDRFDPEAGRTGQADLTVGRDGAIVAARITLSLRMPDGTLLDRAGLMTAALHEVGHAIGLGHSGRTDDLMFPSPSRPQISARDRRTAELIYGLPPGSVKTGGI